MDLTFAPRAARSAAQSAPARAGRVSQAGRVRLSSRHHSLPELGEEETKRPTAPAARQLAQSGTRVAAGAQAGGEHRAGAVPGLDHTVEIQR
jgi:hypothetical protein